MDTVHLVVGGDLVHVDTDKATTTTGKDERVYETYGRHLLV